jgi:hypothetical protein
MLAGAILCAVPAFGQEADASSLKGVSRVRVVVDDISRDAERAGLTKAVLQSDVELWLRQKNIVIDGAAPEQLYVEVDTANNSSGGYAYSVDVGFRQPATLQRTGKAVLAETWSDGTVGSIISAKLASAVRGKLQDLLDGFIKEYLGVNPKR